MIFGKLFKLENKKLFFSYVFFALVFVIFFGEIIGPLIAGNPLVFLQFPIPMTIYYLILSFIFGLVAMRARWYFALIVFFVYGVVVEMLLFGNVKGITDVPGILFFGFFYVFLFGAPMAVVFLFFRKRIHNKIY